MAQVEGVVDKIQNRGKAWNLCVDGSWYGFGFNEPDFSEGAKVSFDVKMNGRYANVDNDTFKVVEAKPTKATKGSTGGPSGGSYDDRQASINWQSARNAAIAFVEMAVNAGTVSLPTAKAKKMDALSALVDQYTEQYYYDTENVATGNIEAVVGKTPEQPEGDELEDE